MTENKIKAAEKAGMIRSGDDLMGTHAQWNDMMRYEYWLDTYKRFPNDKDGYTEIEPNVFTK